MTSASEEQYPGEPFRLGKPNVAGDRRPQYVEAEIQVARHAADDRELLPVLFAKDRDVGADLVEQLGDDGRDPVEMAGTRGAAIIGAQLGDFDAAAVPRGIHNRDVGRPQKRYLYLDQQRSV